VLRSGAALAFERQHLGTLAQVPGAA
jgi:hypothetical protein